MLVVSREARSRGVASVWRSLAGPPDLGAIDFADVRRRRFGNDALIAPPGLCGSTPVDAAPPIFEVPVECLQEAMRCLEAHRGDLELVFRARDYRQERYVVRSPLLKLPATVNVRYLPLGADRCTLALHSRSQIGWHDFGANRARLQSWIGQLLRLLPAADTGSSQP